MNKQSLMILNCVKEVDTGSVKTALMKVLSYIAMNLKISGVCTETMTLENLKYLEEHCDYNMLKETPFDYFTPVLERLQLIPKSPSGTKVNIQKELALHKEEVAHLSKPVLQLILPKYTNQLLVASFLEYNDSAIYAVVEPNIILYRTLLITGTLYSIPAMVLNADPLIHTINMESPNWSFVNKWEGTSGIKLEVLSSDRNL